MILPTTYAAALLLLIVSMLGWGSWANTQKLSGKWRFELFYYDYSIGMLHSGYLDDNVEKAKMAALQIDPRAKKRAPKPTGAARGIILSVISGILMGCFYPMLELARQGEAGLAPYGLALFFAIGVIGSSLFYVPFFLNFPVSGEPIQAKDYFQGNLRQHLLGLAGGAIWMIGGISNFAAAASPVSIQVGPAVSYALGQGATMVSALWGLVVWHEFRGASPRVRTLIAFMLVLFVAGLGMVSIAPLHATK